MSRKHEETFGQRRAKDGRLGTGNNFHITTHGGLTDENHRKITLHTCRDGQNEKKGQRHQMQNRTSQTLLVGTVVQPLEKSWSVSYKTKHTTTT